MLVLSYTHDFDNKAKKVFLLVYLFYQKTNMHQHTIHITWSSTQDGTVEKKYSLFIITLTIECIENEKEWGICLHQVLFLWERNSRKKKNPFCFESWILTPTCIGFWKKCRSWTRMTNREERKVSHGLAASTCVFCSWALLLLTGLPAFI